MPSNPIRIVSAIYGANLMSLTVEAKHKRFKNPPIVEAIIAVTIAPLPESALATLEGLSAEIGILGYTLATPMTSHAVQLAIEKGVSRASNRDELTGYQFFSADRRFAFQALRTGLVFSQLGHYESWELFTGEAKKIWDIYLAAIGEVSLVQYAVRYINKIFVPLGQPTEDYVRLYIEVPPTLPQEIFDPYLRLVFRLSNPPGTLTHQQGLLPPEKEGYASTLLDNNFSFSAANMVPATLWPAIDAVRDTKDYYFFNMLTDKMKETFDA
jgi:uncharacterized protein (TIGR04255 family)